MNITDLTAQNLRRALGLSCAEPALSYRLWSPRRGARQTAYQIEAATSETLLNHDQADLWDSGRVEDTRNYAIPYQGKPLSSRQRVFWRVRVWDEEGKPSDWSRSAWFEMGLLSPADWKGKWIGRGDGFLGDKSPSPALARQFLVEDLKSVERARLYISGLGLFCASVNGQKVTDALFEPGESQFDQRVYYVTYDVTGMLREGRNALGVLLGNGQYANFAVDPVMRFGDGSLNEKHRYQKYDTIYLRDGICGNVKLLAQLELIYRDGRIITAVSSDESWSLFESPVTFQNWYGGEDYDGQRALALRGWDTPFADLAGWEKAVFMEPPKGRLTARECEPIRIWESWTAKSVAKLPNGNWLVDFGKNSAGFIRLKLENTKNYAGCRIRLYPAEVLAADGGGVDQASCTQSCDRLFDCRVMDSYVVAGAGTEEWHPQFCYHGFQYAEVEGFPGEPSVRNFEGCAVRLMNRKVSDFETDQEMINRIHRMTDRSIESNMMYSFTDCPQIEKLGWLETTQLMFSSMAAGYDIRSWIPKIIGDMQDARVTRQTLEKAPMEADPVKYPGFDFLHLENRETEEAGFVPGIAPEYFRIGRLYKDPNWGGACVLAPWYYYQEYGDERILAEHYDMMQDYVEHLNRQAKDGVLKNYAHMGEWGQINENTPTTLVATCAFYLLADTLSGISGILGKDREQARYRELAKEIRCGFYKDPECFCEKSGVYGNASQASYGCVLFSGIARPEERETLVERLVEAVREKDWHLTSGEVGLKQVFCALAVAGRNDVVYRMVMNPTEPSYRHHVDQGLTTLPEFWNYTELWNGLGRSRNHAMMGHVKEWLSRYVMGIVSLAPGYEKLRISPWLNEEIKRVRGSVFTVRGTVAVDCSREPEKLRMCANIPVGATAEVHIPCGPDKRCYEIVGDERREVNGRRSRTALILNQVTSGSYCWETE
ncbi:MAG: family 78 glycoside hydrolase catalytic domain [Eubacteriales bacterium]|nr:family 78 glycoside hydrolase catalytic domain [Eubacteriales bacterium]